MFDSLLTNVAAGKPLTYKKLTREMYRLYVEEKLSLRRKRGRKPSTVRQPLPQAVAANQV